MSEALVDPNSADESGIDFEKLAQASRRAALLSGIGIAVFFSALGFSVWQVQSAQSELMSIREKLATASKDLLRANTNLTGVRTQTDSLRAELASLEADQVSVVETLGEVLDAGSIKILDRDVHFVDIEKDFSELPTGRRRQAMLAAILYAWKSVPFSTGGKDLMSGIGSTEFLLKVLGRVGIVIPEIPGSLRSESIKTLPRFETPQVGDIALYKGSVGNYGVFVISLGATSGGPIGLGGYNESLPVQIRSLLKGNPKKHPLLGYYRPPYDQPAPSTKVDSSSPP